MRLSCFRSSTSIAELDLKDLKEDLRSFIEQSRMGNKGIKELVSRESMDIRKHMSFISAETSEVLGRVDQCLDNLVLTSGDKVNQAKRERLLQSLRYPGLNERRNHVSDAYENTGKWIFAGDCNEVDNTEDSAPHSDAVDSNISESNRTTQDDHYELSQLKWDSFSNWLRSTDTFYWISGKPGSGKSTLVKFILDHPDTKAFLEVWNPQTLIVSHFFWRPGTQLQQNIKGLLCSLLYQLLYNSTMALSSVLSSVPDANTKIADTDWSAAELEGLCLQVSSAYHRPLCVFIDGLDEVDPKDGVVSLLRFIDKLSQSTNTKICLSSRPEPLLHRRLSIYPRLRLQDLNRGDLELYARDNVRFPDDYIAEHYEDPIVSLVERAEGVFLWLVLATKSINKGWEYGDTTAMFQQRIDRLPGDLTSLYKDMWNRACEDDPLVYRQTAALYFKLLLAHRNRDALFRSFFHNLELLTLMLASTSTADQILQAGDEVLKLFPEDVMLQRCKEVVRNVSVYCFGLIELRETDSAPAAAVGMYGHNYDRLIPFTGASKVLRFIHRTAHDFLTDTVEGKEILRFDTSSRMSLELRITKAYLAGSQLLLHGDNCVSLGASFNGVPLCLIRRLRLSHGATDDWLESEWGQLLQHCEALCNAGKLFAGSRGRARLCKGDDFLKAVANTCGDTRILSAIKHKTLAKDTKSEILLNACNLFANGFGSLMNRDSFVESSIRALLMDGADPNFKGTLFSPDLWFWPFARLETPFTAYLESNLMQVKDGRMNSAKLFGALETLCIYISQKASLDNKVTFYFDLRDGVRPGFQESTKTLEPFQFVQILWCHRDLVLSADIKTVLFASFSAHDILEALLYTIRRDYSTEAEENRIQETLSFLENECRNWHSSESPRVFGRLCHGEDTSEESVWFETTGEHQERVGTELLDQLRYYKSLSHGVRRDRWRMSSDTERVDSVLSLCAQEPWSLKASGQDAIWMRFEELGFFTRIDGLCEVHSTEEWVKRRQS